MIARLIEFSARNRFLVVLLIAAVIGGGLWAVYHTPLDAIPDLSDVQVIVYTPWEDQSPSLIEDQVTYPIVTQLLSAPRVKAVRAPPSSASQLISSSLKAAAIFSGAATRVRNYGSGTAA